MRWVSYFILAYLAIGLQIGLAPYLRYHSASPNLVLLAVIFIAINAPRDAALLGCFCLGALQDLVTAQQPGLLALAYGLTAMFVVSTQQLVYREHALTHFSMALIGGSIAATIVLLHAWVRPPGPALERAGVHLPAIRPSIALEFTRVLYTAILAPFVLWGLQRIKKVFSFQPTRRKVKAWG